MPPASYNINSDEQKSRPLVREGVLKRHHILRTKLACFTFARSFTLTFGGTP